MKEVYYKRVFFRMNGFSHILDKQLALRIAFELEDRSIEGKNFNSNVKHLVKAVAKSNYSSSKSLKEKEKVNDLVKDFKACYFSCERPDIFSHKLMKKVIKHRPVDELYISDTTIVAESIANRFECISLIDRSDKWLTHFFISLIGPAQFDEQREIGKKLPKEKMEALLSHQQALLDDLIKTDAADFHDKTLVMQLIRAIEDLNLNAPSFLEAPKEKTFNYLLYRFESFILQFIEFKEEARKVLISTLNIFYETADLYHSEEV